MTIIPVVAVVGTVVTVLTVLTLGVVAVVNDSVANVVGVLVLSTTHKHKFINNSVKRNVKLNTSNTSSFSDKSDWQQTLQKTTYQVPCPDNSLSSKTESPGYQKYYTLRK